MKKISYKKSTTYGNNRWFFFFFFWICFCLYSLFYYFCLLLLLLQPTTTITTYYYYYYYFLYYSINLYLLFQNQTCNPTITNKQKTRTFLLLLHQLELLLLLVLLPFINCQSIINLRFFCWIELKTITTIKKPKTNNQKFDFSTTNCAFYTT